MFVKQYGNQMEASPHQLDKSLLSAANMAVAFGEDYARGIIQAAPQDFGGDIKLIAEAQREVKAAGGSLDQIPFSILKSAKAHIEDVRDRVAAATEPSRVIWNTVIDEDKAPRPVSPKKTLSVLIP